MVRPAENSEKETLKNFPQENRNPDEKERERAMFVYNSSYNQKPKLRESEFFKKQKKIRTKILIPSYCAKIKVREQSVKLQMVPPNMTTNESKSNPERAELG